MIIFREATSDERHGTIRSQWINRIAPRRDGRDEGPHGINFGRKDHAISRELATRMVELVVGDLLATDAVEVLVAELDRVPGEIIGWAAFEPGAVLHFVCVPGASKSGSGFGRAKVATKLMARVGELPCSWSTANGRALLRSLGRSEA